jgi:adenylate cyclase
MRAPVVFWLSIVLASGTAGAVYGVVLDDDESLTRGAVFGVFIGVIVTLHERGLLLGDLREAIRKLPTLPYFLAAEAVLLGLVLLGMLGAGSLSWLAGLGSKTLRQSIVPSESSVAYSLLVCAGFIFVLRVRDLLGAEIFANLMLGRYRRPVSEERVFLFLDLVGSTAYAEKHGDLAAQELLMAVFAAIAEPVRRHRGQIDDYVGDQIIVSWPFARGVDEARCVACSFAIGAALSRRPEWWRSRFGLVPTLRSALHGGSVVTAEVGVDRHKIAYFGDVMNATARLEGLCRETGLAVLISDAVLSRIAALPPGIAAEPLGQHHLRGRTGSMTVHALLETQAGDGTSAAPRRGRGSSAHRPTEARAQALLPIAPSE